MSQASVTRKKTGRPTKYKVEYCDLVIELMNAGYTFEAFAAHVGVAPSTAYEWAEKNQEFREAKKIAKAGAITYWINQLRDISSNSFQRNPTPALFMLKTLGLSEDRDLKELQKEKLRLEIARMKAGEDLPDDDLSKLPPEALRKINEIAKPYLLKTV